MPLIPVPRTYRAGPAGFCAAPNNDERGFVYGLYLGCSKIVVNYAVASEPESANGS